jgi:hypothetical protein
VKNKLSNRINEFDKISEIEFDPYFYFDRTGQHFVKCLCLKKNLLENFCSCQMERDERLTLERKRKIFSSKSFREQLIRPDHIISAEMF